MPVTPATSTRRSRPEADARILDGLVEASTPWARGASCCCPTTRPRSPRARNTADPVFHPLVDSEIDGPGGVYYQPATAGCAAYPGKMLGRLLALTLQLADRRPSRLVAARRRLLARQAPRLFRRSLDRVGVR
jgi:hypothetical protein